MIPTPAKRRHFEPHKQRVGPEEDDDDDDEEEEETRNGAAEAHDGFASVNKQFGRLPLAEQRLLLCRQQQHLSRDLGDDHDQAQQQQQQQDQVEMFDEDDELDYLGLDTIVEEDESNLDLSEQNGNVRSSAAADDVDDETPRPRDHRQQQQQAKSIDKLDSSKELDNSQQQRPPVELSSSSSSCSTELNNVCFQQQNGSLSLISETTTTTTNELNSINLNEQQLNSSDQATMSNNNNQCDKQQQANKQRSAGKMHHHHQGPLLPSTNRLISEHQARQQQTTLFKALAERQKILDELSPMERQQIDLLSTNSTDSLISLRLSSQRSNNAKQPLQRRARSTSRTRRRTGNHNKSSVGDEENQQPELRARSRSSNRRGRRRSLSRHRTDEESGANDHEEAIPLSAVDFSSMSDRMLDELLGHIASASSSSSLNSSNTNESLGSSEVSSSASASCSSSETEELENNPSSQRSRRSQPQQTPSVIGVHEDAEAIGRGNRNRLGGDRNCRDAHRRSRRRGTDDDDDRNDRNDQSHHRQGDQMLAVSISNSQAQSSSLSPLTSNHNHKNNSNNSIDQLQRRRSSSQVGTTPTDDKDDEEPPHQPHQDQSVEAVLGRMLEALNEIGVSEEQEQLNDLLERGFLHLETLLNCSLAPAASALSTTDGSQPQHQPPPQQQQHHKSISLINNNHNLNSTTTILSKDSDYGSDTQSADCFNCSPASDQQTLTPASDSSPSTVAASQHSAGALSNGQQQAKQQMKSGLLSPLAIELSFKLAESLRRLSQRQQLAQDNGSGQREQPATMQSDSMTTSSTTNSADDHEQEAAARHAPAKQQQQQNSDSDSGSQTTTRSAGGKRTPMKSIVLINSVASPSPFVDRQPQLAARNSTPTTTIEPASRPQSRQNYKTLVNLNSAAATATTSPEVAANNEQVSSVKIRVEEAGQVAPSDTSKQQQERQANVLQELANSNEINTIQIQSKLPINSNFVRRRSSRRSSLRRRPSFGNGQQQPRPGSPVPLAVLEVPASGRSVASTNQVECQPTNKQEQLKMQHQQQQRVAVMRGDDGAAREPGDEQQQNNQLRRALILAQKYNYSPAKLAASKLSSKLQLNNSSLQNNATPAVECHKYLAGANDEFDRQQGTTTTTTKFQAEHQNGLRSEQRDSTTTTTRKSGGQMQLDISYLAKSGSLTVHILQCRNLTAVNKRKTTSNPYVKIYLLPDKSKNGKRKSATKRNELEPQFDEKFTFGPIQLGDFDKRILWLSVWHKDRLGKRNEFLGELLLPLAQVRLQLFQSDLCHSTSAKWYPISLERLQSNNSLPSNGHLQQQQHQHQHQHQQQPIKSDRSSASVMLPPSYEVAPRAQQKQAAEQVARKLNEFERKAAQLTAQSGALFLATTQLTGADQFCSPASKLAPPSANHTNNSRAKNQPEVMNVTLGPLLMRPSNGSSQHLDQLSAPTAQLASSNPITGQLFVALKFVPDNVGEPLARRSVQMEGELRVLIKEARQIGGFNSASPAKQGNAKQQQAGSAKYLPSPYCKCYLLDSQGQRVAKQKTPQLKRTSNPRWDQECAFQQLRLANLSAQAIEILLFNRDSILVSTSECLGGIRLCRKQTTMSSNSNSNHETVSLASSNGNHSAQDFETKSNGDSTMATLRSNKSNEQVDELNNEICSEKEAKLWTQMLARPNIWVYGELPLRQLRQLVPGGPISQQQQQLN